MVTCSGDEHSDEQPVGKEEGENYEGEHGGEEDEGYGLHYPGCLLEQLHHHLHPREHHHQDKKNDRLEKYTNDDSAQQQKPLKFGMTVKIFRHFQENT